MTINKAEQVRHQYDAVARLARTLAKVHEQSSFILNEMDAASEDDSDLDPVFESAHAMFPVSQDAF